MVIAASVCTGLAALFGWGLYRSFRRSKVADGNIEGFLVFVYLPLTVVTGGLSLLFWFLALILP